MNYGTVKSRTVNDGVEVNGDQATARQSDKIRLKLSHSKLCREAAISINHHKADATALNKYTFQSTLLIHL